MYTHPFLSAATQLAQLGQFTRQADLGLEQQQEQQQQQQQGDVESPKDWEDGWEDYKTHRECGVWGGDGGGGGGERV